MLYTENKLYMIKYYSVIVSNRLHKATPVILSHIAKLPLTFSKYEFKQIFDDRIKMLLWYCHQTAKKKKKNLGNQSNFYMVV